MGIRFDAKTVGIDLLVPLGGVIHIGLEKSSGGRVWRSSIYCFGGAFTWIGVGSVGRLKTGMPPRIDARSVDFSVMIPQPGDFPSPTMSFMGDVSITLNKWTAISRIPMNVISTKLFAVVDRSTMYTGVIEGVGPRYCPIDWR